MVPLVLVVMVPLVLVVMVPVMRTMICGVTLGRDLLQP